MTEYCIPNVLCLKCNLYFANTFHYQQHVELEHSDTVSGTGIDKILPSDSETGMPPSAIKSTYTCGGCNMKCPTEDCLLMHLDFCQGTPTVDLDEESTQEQVQPKKPKKVTVKTLTKVKAKKESKVVLKRKNQMSDKLKKQRQELSSHKKQRRENSKKASGETKGVVLGQIINKNNSGRTLRSSTNVSYMDIDTDVDEIMSEVDCNDVDTVSGDDDNTWKKNVCKQKMKKPCGINKILPSDSEAGVTPSVIKSTYTCGGCNIKCPTEDCLLMHLDCCQGTPEELIQEQVQPKKITVKRQAKVKAKKESRMVLKRKNQMSDRLKKQRQELGSHKKQRRVKSKKASVETDGVVLGQIINKNNSGRTLRSSTNVSYMDIDTDVDDIVSDFDWNDVDTVSGDDDNTWKKKVKIPKARKSHRESKAKLVMEVSAARKLSCRRPTKSNIYQRLRSREMLNRQVETKKTSVAISAAVEKKRNNEDFVLERNGFKCDHCSISFPTKEILEEHMCKDSYDVIEDVYKCKLCFKINKNLHSMKRHLQSHRQKEMGEVFPCQICGREYQTPDGRDRHAKTHKCDGVLENKVNFTCDICHKSQATRDGHLKHMKGHSERNEKQQQQKDVDTEDYTLYINGEKVEDKQEKSSLKYIHKCEICGTAFNSEKNLHLHIARHNLTKTNGLFDCPHCDKKQQTDDGWRKHMNTHFLEEKKYLYQCNKCGHNSPTMESVKKHLKTQHADKQGGPLQCNICGCWLETWSGLKKHLQRHEEMNSGKTYDCSTCNKVFQSESGLRRHKKIHMEMLNGVKHICHVCGLELQSLKSLLRHEHRHNEAEGGKRKRYQCTTCGKAFTLLGGLRKHAMVHTEDSLLAKSLWWRCKFGERKLPRNYGMCKRRQCRICGLQCRSFVLLLLHEQKRHVVERLDCTLCEQRFYHQCVYDSHVRHHAGKKNFECKQCSESCSDSLTWRRHKKAHETELIQSAKDLFNSLLLEENNKETMLNIKKMYGKKMLELVQCLQKGEELGDKHYLCNICGHTTGVHFDYIRHVESHTGTRPFKCALCNRAFFTLSHLNEHITSHTGDRKPYSCTVCGKVFSTETSIRRHENLHAGMKLVWCTVCHKKLPSRYSLMKHRAEVHDGQNNIRLFKDYSKLSLTTSNLTSPACAHSSDRSYPCSQCGKCYSSMASLKTHEKKHTEIKPHQCDCCKRSFYQPHELRKHKLQVHLGSNPYICSFMGCQATFQFKCDLQLHSAGHYNVNKEPILGYFPCNKCDIVFQSAMERYTHRKIAHTKKRAGKYETCEYCGKKVNAVYMKVHVRKHTGETLECDLCGKKFYDERMLKNHLLVHNNMKPYSCDVCGKKTVTTSEMKIHKRLHTGEKPYQCQYCEKNFRDNGTWKAHEMRHRGEKPYQCPNCPMAFVTSSILRRHLRKRHKNAENGHVKCKLNRKKKKVELSSDSESNISDYVVFDDSEDNVPVKEEMDDIDVSEWITSADSLPSTKVESAENEPDSFDIPVITCRLPAKQMEISNAKAESSGSNDQDPFEIPFTTVRITKPALSRENSLQPELSLRVPVINTNKPIATAMIGPDSDEEFGSSNALGK